MSNGVSIDLTVGQPGQGGATVTLFCGVMALLEKQYPKRSVDQAELNRLIGLITELEQAYAALPASPGVADSRSREVTP